MAAAAPIGTMSDMSTEHSEYSTLRVESENASRDYDALVAKLALAGLTLSAASKSILEGNDWLLGFAVGSFTAATVASLLSLRIAADALRRQATTVSNGASPESAYSGESTWHNVVAVLDWAALATVVAGLVFACLFAMTARSL